MIYLLGLSFVGKILKQDRLSCIPDLSHSGVGDHNKYDGSIGKQGHASSGVNWRYWDLLLKGFVVRDGYTLFRGPRRFKLCDLDRNGGRGHFHGRDKA